MKIILTGATGGIGSALLHHCLIHPSITSVVALTRKPLPFSDPKLEVILINNFEFIEEGVFNRISDADALLWCMGTSTVNAKVNIEYPIAFRQSLMKAQRKHQSQRQSQKPFQYIHLSGAFVERDQDKSLWFLSKNRKFHGVKEIKLLEYDAAENHNVLWKMYIIKPGAFMRGDYYGDGLMACVLGTSGAITGDECGAFVADMVVRGDEPVGFVENKRMVMRGRELLLARPVAPRGWRQRAGLTT